MSFRLDMLYNLMLLDMLRMCLLHMISYILFVLTLLFLQKYILLDIPSFLHLMMMVYMFHLRNNILMDMLRKCLNLLVNMFLVNMLHLPQQYIHLLNQS